ncbi:hypothetical protein OK016_16930 [Vibrio chagasii]|nr:hypothetical protein [Vibrio chagasii]
MQASMNLFGVFAIGGITTISIGPNSTSPRDQTFNVKNLFIKHR